MEFEFKDKDGNNDGNFAGVINLYKDAGTILIKAEYGDMDGDHYQIYVPNHREKLFALAAGIFELLELTKDWPEGYDGFSFNFAGCPSSGNTSIWNEDEIGVVKWYG